MHSRNWKWLCVSFTFILSHCRYFSPRMLLLQWKLQLRYFLIPFVFNTHSANKWNDSEFNGIYGTCNKHREKVHSKCQLFFRVLVQPPAFKSLSLYIHRNCLLNSETKYSCVMLLWIRNEARVLNVRWRLHGNHSNSWGAYWMFSFWISSG